MPRQKETWITGKEAAEILSAKSGHTVSQTYVRYLAYGTQSNGYTSKIRHQMRDGRTTEYLKSDVEKCGPVRERAEKQPRPKRPDAPGRKPRVRQVEQEEQTA